MINANEVTTTRPDTLATLSPGGVLSGCALVRNLRDLHGRWLDDRSEISLVSISDPAGYIPLLDLENGQAVCGYLLGWHVDTVGLWIEAQLCQYERLDALLELAGAQGLYFCLNLGDGTLLDANTGYLSKVVACYCNVTQFPSLRPNSWQSVNEYLDLLDIHGCDLTGISADLEAVPLGERLPEPLPYGNNQEVIDGTR